MCNGVRPLNDGRKSTSTDYTTELHNLVSSLQGEVHQALHMHMQNIDSARCAPQDLRPKSSQEHCRARPSHLDHMLLWQTDHSNIEFERKLLLLVYLWGLRLGFRDLTLVLGFGLCTLKSQKRNALRRALANPECKLFNSMHAYVVAKIPQVREHLLLSRSCVPAHILPSPGVEYMLTTLTCR